jgi:hypothetical protein
VEEGVKVPSDDIEQHNGIYVGIVRRRCALPCIV